MLLPVPEETAVTVLRQQLLALVLHGAAVVAEVMETVLVVVLELVVLVVLAVAATGLLSMYLQLPEL
jgi:hypothetical protein